MKKNSDIDNKITILKEEIDKLKNYTTTKNVWYKNISTLISILALLISFSTTIISFFHTRTQDIEDRKGELREIFQRMSILPKENMELYNIYQNSPYEIQMLGGYINQENSVLINQAIDIINNIPKSRITATDYYTLINALLNSNMFNEALDYIPKAIADCR